MQHHETLTRSRWPSTPEFSEIANDWTAKFSTLFIQLVWEGVDLLGEEVLSLIDGNAEPRQVERSLGLLLHNRIQRIMNRALPFVLAHEPYDLELLATPGGRPPQPDLGFVMNAGDRVIWPVEFKVLAHESDTAAYVREVRNSFLNCRYASLTAEGAMLGWLRSGEPAIALGQIAQELKVIMQPGASNPPRHHMVSEHARSVPPGARYAAAVRCHHLMALVVFGPNTGAERASGA